MERDLFLSRVRSSLGGSVLPAVDGPSAAPSIAFDDPTARFLASAAAVDADVVRIADGQLAVSEATRLAASLHDPGGYIAWDGLDGIAPGLYDAMTGSGWQRIDATVGTGSRLDDHRRIERAKVGISGADAAIAATGSVVLTHGPGRPRSVSLLAEHHIVILPRGRLVASLAEVMGGIDWSSTSNVVAITGPSRTGDIESILTLGVHGPRHLSIVLIG